jgi:hypothetical protein
MGPAGAPKPRRSLSFSYPGYERIRTHNRVFSSVMALAGNGSSLNVGYKGEPGRAGGELGLRLGATLRG